MSAVREVLVEWICMDDVVAMDKIRYNTNNNYEEGQQPEDYLEVTEGTVTSKWIDSFKAYKKIDLDLTSVLTFWLRKAARIGIHTGKFPQTFEDELEMLVNAIEPANRDIFDGTEYFI
jgi:hypothetical protein